MPAVSAKQYRLMQAILHGRVHGKNKPSKKVAREFVNATSAEKRSAWSKDHK